MGGKAIKKVIVSRIKLDNYNLIKKDIFNKLSEYIKLNFLREVPNKIDFGDLDIIYKANEKIDLRKLIIDIYNPEEIVINGTVMSISYYFKSLDEYYQVDFIKCQNLEMSYFFFSYGDVGGIIGTITKFYGISFGEGLFCNISKETIELHHKNDMENFCNFKIELITDPKEICTYLNLDYEKWCVGFESKEEIFNWIISSSWFHKDIFINLNHHRNHQKNTRPLYKEFNDYIFDESRLLSNNELKKENKQFEAIVYFNKIKLLDNFIIQHKIDNERKNKFNGRKFMKYGYEGKNIGNIMNQFKKYIQGNNNEDIFNNNEDIFNNWLDTNNEIFIDNEINNFINSKNII